jgi:hypothetical protein
MSLSVVYKFIVLISGFWKTNYILFNSRCGYVARSSSSMGKLNFSISLCHMLKMFQDVDIHCSHHLQCKCEEEDGNGLIYRSFSGSKDGIQSVELSNRKGPYN